MQVHIMYDVYIFNVNKKGKYVLKKRQFNTVKMFERTKWLGQVYQAVICLLCLKKLALLEL